MNTDFFSIVALQNRLVNAIGGGADATRFTFMKKQCAAALLAALFLSALMPSVGHAANKTWTTGAGTANWNVGSNWGGTVPASADALIFGNTTGVTTLNDNLMTPGTFNVAGITFNSGAPAYIINPNTAGTNGFTLTGSLVNNSTNLQTINDLIAMTVARTFQTAAGGGNLAIGGVISGTGGGVTKAGVGTLTLTGTNTYTGLTSVNLGSIVYGSSSAPSITQTLSGGLTFGTAAPTLANNAGSVTSVLGSSGNASLTIGGAITFNSLGTGNFITSGGTSSTNTITLSGASAGFLKNQAFFNGADYAYVGAGNVLRAPVYGTDSGFSTAGSALVSGAHNLVTTSITGQGSDSVNTIKFGTSSPVDLTQTGGTTLTLNASSGILRSGGGSTTISGGSITQATGLAYIFRADSSSDTLTINSNILANGVNTLTTSGAGTVTLGGVNTYTGTTAVNEGTTTVTGTLATAAVTVIGGTLNLNNTNALTGSATITLGQTAINTNGTISIAAANNNTGAINLNGGTLIIGATTGALGTGTLTTQNFVTTIQASGAGNHTISNVFNNAVVGTNIGGSSDLTFGGQLTNAISGTQLFTINNSGTTTFSGGIIESNAAGARVFTLSGPGNVLINSLITTNSGATGAQGLSYVGSGTLTLANTNSGAVSAQNTGSNAITIATGVAPVTGVVGTSGTTGNSTLKISGNYTIGTAGINTLVIAGGNGTTTTRGTLSLVDGAANTLTINSTAVAANVLTMAAAGAASNLNMEIGSTSDTITLGSGQKVSVGAGGVNLNITGLGGMASGGQTMTLLTAPGTGLTAGGTQFTLATSGNFSGYTTANLTSTTTTALVLTLGGYTVAPATAFWKGGQDGSWGTLAGGIANNSNWNTDLSSAIDTHQVVDSTSDVTFSATGAANTATTLNTSYSIKSLTFNGNASVSNNTLTVGNTTTGITAGTGATGTINSVLAGSSGVTKNGVGAVVLGGNNTYTGGLTINDGAVRVANVGALNSTTPQSVTFGASAPSTAKLQLNGNSITIGALSTNATPGTPVVENANASAATLTVSQSSNTSYAGTLVDGTGGGALNLVKTGSGALTLDGGNAYTGTTAINQGTLLVNGNSSSATGAVTVSNASTAGSTLGGTGTVGGAVTIGSGGRITGGSVGTVGALNLSNNLTFNSGSIAYFDINDGGTYDSITAGGTLTFNSGSIIQVPTGLAASATYNLISYTGSVSSLSTVTFQGLGGGSTFSGTYDSGTNTYTSGTYTFGSSLGNLTLTIVAATTASPTITMALTSGGSPLASRVMQNTAIAASGTVGNTGPTTLNGAVSSTGSLAITSLTPTSVTLAQNATTPYTGSVNSGTTLGANSIGVQVNDPSANPTTASNSVNVSVLQDRVVFASTVTSFGSVHQGATVSGTTSLTSTGADDSNTRVTVANATADANGIAVTGGTGPTFNGSASDTRTVSGNISTLGTVNGAITLTTTGEAGISGTQSPVNVTVNYSASVYSGKAAWTSGSSGNWVTGANWADTLGGGVAGSPGVDGSLSIGDTATFGDVTGSPASLTVSLNGTSPTLAGMTFNSTATAYTIATGSGGTITLQGAATPVNVSTTFSPTISANLVGSGLSKTGTGTLVLSGANTFTGATAITNGAIQVTGANDRLPVATTVTLGASTNSGKLILGDGTTAWNQTLAGLLTSGTGTTNSVVGAAATNSILTMNIATTDTYAGILGGAGSNENNLTLAKTGAGTLILTGNNTYTGGTTLTTGILQAGSSGAINSSGAISFAGGTLQFSSSSAANANNYLGRFTTTGQAYKLDTNGVAVAMDDSTSGTPFNTASGSLTKSGTGTLTLTNTGSYALPTTTINGGVLQADTLLGSTPALLSGSTLTLSGISTLSSIFQASGTLSRAVGNTTTNAAAGGLNWGNYSGFSAIGGKLTINTGVTNPLVWGNNVLGVGGSQFSFGSTTSNNQVEVQNAITMGNAGVTAGTSRTIFVEKGVGGDSTLLSGVLSDPLTTAGTGAFNGNNGLTKTGAGTLILSAVNNSAGTAATVAGNTYTGTTTVSNGTLVAAANSSSAAPVTQTVNTTYTSGVNTIILNSVTGLAIGQSVSVTSTGGAIGSVTSGTYITGIDTNTNTITLSQNTIGGAAPGLGLSFGTPGVFGVGAGAILLGDASTPVAANVSLKIGSADNNTASTSGGFTVYNPVTIQNFANGAYSIGGNSASTAAFAGLITTNQNMSVTQVTGGTLNITGGITGASATAKTVTFDNVGAVNVSTTGITNGAGTVALVKTNSGNLTLSATNTYTGGTTINGGTLTIGDGGAVAGNITNNAALVYALNSTSGSYGGVISGSGTFTKTGTSDLTFTGANTYTGATTITGGTLYLDTTGTIANSTTINLGTAGSQGILDLELKSGTFAFGAGQTLSGYGKVFNNSGSGAAVTVNGHLSPGNSAGIITVAGDLVLANAATVPATGAITTMELAGNGGVAGTDYDQVIVNGQITFGGTLNVISYLSYNISQAATYHLFGFGSQAGSSFDFVSVAGTSLTNSTGVWAGSASGFDYTFTESTGDLIIAVGSAIPEPSTYAALAGGLALVATWISRRRHQKI